MCSCDKEEERKGEGMGQNSCNSHANCLPCLCSGDDIIGTVSITKEMMNDQRNPKGMVFVEGIVKSPCPLFLTFKKAFFSALHLTSVWICIISYLCLSCWLADQSDRWPAFLSCTGNKKPLKVDITHKLSNQIISYLAYL